MLRGVKKLYFKFTLTMAAYDLIKLPRLIGVAAWAINKSPLKNATEVSSKLQDNAAQKDGYQSSYFGGIFSTLLDLSDTSSGGGMQTTRLGVAIVIILALVAALVGPLFIDWSRHRSEFEAKAAWVTGLEFRVTGRIDARLLPTPTLTLHDVEIGPPGGGSSVRVRALHVEYELGALVRGEWRAKSLRARLSGRG
jgi:hypothetical protein